MTGLGFVLCWFNWCLIVKFLYIVSICLLCLLLTGELRCLLLCWLFEVYFVAGLILICYRLVCCNCLIGDGCIVLRFVVCVLGFVSSILFLNVWVGVLLLVICVVCWFVCLFWFN